MEKSFDEHIISSKKRVNERRRLMSQERVVEKKKSKSEDRTKDDENISRIIKSFNKNLATMTNEEISKAFGRTEKDTSSIEFQIAKLTARILNIENKVLKNNKNDAHAHHAHGRMIHERQVMLAHLRLKDKKSYDKIIKDLYLNKAKIDNDNIANEIIAKDVLEKMTKAHKKTHKRRGGSNGKIGEIP